MKLKKVGIVTWHWSPNYGGLVQAYALQETIKKLGYEPEFVNYREDLSTFKKRIIRKLKDFYIMLLQPSLYRSRQKNYDFIADKLNVGKLYYSYEKLADEADGIYDACVCGSDQIWSNNRGYVDPFYYLDFISENKRISYAPSIGYDKVADNLEKDFKKYVDKIRFLSVREEKGSEIIKNITNRAAKVVLDPSFLLDKKDWLKKIENKSKIAPDEKYIFLYILRYNKDYVDFVRDLSEKTGYRIVTLEIKNIKLDGIETINCNPLDFIELVNNASYIATDSFHGLALSINLEKQFVVFKRFKDDEEICQNSRIYNILSKAGLMDRLISSNTPVTFLEDNEINYDSVAPLINKERTQSMKFLSSSLESVIKDI
ncbi:MAG: polysaccharide pyruvyl transferase family protein [Erysipelotrichaceae bacterium]